MMNGGAPERARADLAGQAGSSPSAAGSPREAGERSRRTHHTDDGTDRAARLRALRISFLAEARTDCVELAGLAAGELAGADWQRARKLAHDLRGSGGSYGFPDVSAAAAAVEGELLAGSRDASRLSGLVRDLDDALARAARSLP